jgi:hypothetical protein
MAGSPHLTSPDVLEKGQHPLPDKHGSKALRSTWWSSLVQDIASLFGKLRGKKPVLASSLQSTPRARAILRSQAYKDSTNKALQATSKQDTQATHQLTPGEFRQHLLDAVSDVEAHKRNRLHALRGR